MLPQEQERQEDGLGHLWEPAFEADDWRIKH